MKTVFVFTDRYFEYDYGPSHPLRIERLRLTYELCRAYGLFDLPDAELVETIPAKEEEIARFHEAAYLEVLKEANHGSLNRFYTCGLGPGDNPVFRGLWEWSMLHAGASLQCAQRVLEGKARIAFNIAGGLHHAGAGRASGFCYVNDPVLVIYHMLDRGKKVLYLDIDAHHGDGVQWAFYEDPRVLTLSFHQDGFTLFPGSGSVSETGKGTGLGYSVNVPMLPGTDDEVFLEGFFAIVPRLLESFRPDVVVSQLGVDSFWNDPLAALELTTNSFCEVVSFLANHAPAWVALGGGGYEIANVARAWTLAWAIMNGVDLSNDLPQDLAPSLAPARTLRDPAHAGKRRDACGQRMKEVVSFLEREVFPIGGL